MPPRLALTKKQLATKAGEDLLLLLVEITQDGELTDAEASNLLAWVRQQSECVDVPGIALLSEVVGAAVADGVISGVERREIVATIQRILPKEERDAAADHRARREGRDFLRPSKGMLQFMRALQLATPDDLSHADCALQLKNLLDGREEPSNRQVMVLRFWDRTDLAGSGKCGVSAWMTELYGRAEGHREAWELWKSDSGDDGRQGDPNRVPIGAGFDYLKKITLSSAPVENSQPMSAGPSVLAQFGSWLLVKLFQAAIVIGLLIWLLRAIFTPKV